MSQTSEGKRDHCAFNFFPPFLSISIIFLLVLFCFVVYRWTAVNDKRLRSSNLKWGSAIPLVHSYETQSSMASCSEEAARSVDDDDEDDEEEPLLLNTCCHLVFDC